MAFFLYHIQTENIYEIKKTFTIGSSQEDDVKLDGEGLVARSVVFADLGEGIPTIQNFNSKVVVTKNTKIIPEGFYIRLQHEDFIELLGHQFLYVKNEMIPKIQVTKLIKKYKNALAVPFQQELVARAKGYKLELLKEKDLQKKLEAEIRKIKAPLKKFAEEQSEKIKKIDEQLRYLMAQKNLLIDEFEQEKKRDIYQTPAQEKLFSEAGERVVKLEEQIRNILQRAEDEVEVSVLELN